MIEIILGPPGTGKTTTLLDIVDDTLKAGTAPDRIAYISFTRRAAEEAIDRACSKFKQERAGFPYFRTIHSLCYRMLGLRSSDILTGKKFNDFADWCGIRVTGRAWSDDGLLSAFETGDRILFMENLSRIRCVPLREQYDLGDDGLNWNEVDRVARALAQYKQRHGLLDYTDMLTEFMRAGGRPTLDLLVVDESQDLSQLQWRIVRKLMERAKRTVVAGDDDQAIYRWAGADVETLIGLEGNVRVLGQSWRCPRLIQQLSNEVISNVMHRRPKKWKARKGTGVIERESAFDRTEVGGTESTLVLARNQYILREQVEPELKRRGIVYELGGKSSLNMDALRAAESWEGIRNGKDISLGEAKNMYEFLSSGSGVKRGFKKLTQFGEDQSAMVNSDDLRLLGGLVMDGGKPWFDALERLPVEDMAYMRQARERGQKLRDRPSVRLSTIHSAKGAEANHVVLMSEMARRSHYEMQQSPEDEARVWYVGVTRAREKLTVVSSQTPQVCPWI